MKSAERIVAERQRAAERDREAARADAELQARRERTQKWNSVQEVIAPAIEALQATEWQEAGTIVVYRKGLFGSKNVKRAAHLVHKYAVPWKDTTTVSLTSDRQLVVNSEPIVGDTLDLMLKGKGYAGDLPFEEVLAGLRLIAARAY